MINGISPSGQDALAYRMWLRGLVGSLVPSNADMLFEIAWETEYIPTVPNDMNRAHDGTDLRARYVRETSNGLPALGPCTMLEFLVALAHRINDLDYDPEAPNRADVWFWTMIRNLDLIGASEEDIVTAFNNINYRDYAFDGYGGLFPLVRPRQDQREVEIWYQMQAYLLENRY